jgi:NDP-sugar pyrophosphorylase family protein
VGGRPVMEYLVERLRLAPCDEIRVVTRPDKRDVAVLAHRLGATVVAGRPATVAESLLLGLAGLAGDDLVLVGFPDSLWEPVHGFATLLSALDGTTDVVLGCFRSRELERSDVVVIDETGTVTSVQVKPASPASDVVWGCAAATAGALAGLREHAEPGQLFDRLARTGGVRAVRFPGEFVDIGTPEALEQLGVPA